MLLSHLLALSRMSKSTLAANRLIECLNWLPADLLMTGYNQLGDAFTILNDEWLAGDIDQDNANLSTIVGINRSGAIEHRNPMFQGQATAWTYLGFVACGQSHKEARRHQATLKRSQGDGCIEIGTKV